MPSLALGRFWSPILAPVRLKPSRRFTSSWMAIVKSPEGENHTSSDSTVGPDRKRTGRDDRAMPGGVARRSQCLLPRLFSEDARGNIESAELLELLFPELRPPLWRADDLI